MLTHLMCPFCGQHDGLGCALVEKPGGRVVCGCGRHSWPSSAALLETCRLQSLTITGQVHTWTQGY